jgi:hypothetical protein
MRYQRVGEGERPSVGRKVEEERCRATAGQYGFKSFEFWIDTDYSAPQDAKTGLKSYVAPSTADVRDDDPSQGPPCSRLPF